MPLFGFKKKRYILLFKKHKIITGLSLIKKRLLLFFQKLKKAFTLIELLVVIAIIALLAVLSLVSFSNARAEARDAKRLTDIKTIQNGLELYNLDFGQYPSAPLPSGTPITNLCLSNLGITSTCGAIVYAGKLPGDPVGGIDYAYEPIDDGSSYAIAFALESKTANHEAGDYQATPTGIVPVSSTPANWTCGTDTVTDAGNNIYETVQIGSQCWLKKNLNVGVRIDSVVRQGDYADGIQKYCYDDNEANCSTYGGFYLWHMATGRAQVCDDFDCIAYPDNACCTVPVQGICPSGWHIPSLTELQVLAQQADPGCDFSVGSCYTSGGKLKSTAWDGTDDYGFTALPAGFIFYYDQYGVTSSYDGQGDYTSFWLSTPFAMDDSGEKKSDRGYIYGGYSHLYAGYGVRREYGYSVRCIKD